MPDRQQLWPGSVVIVARGTRSSSSSLIGRSSASSLDGHSADHWFTAPIASSGQHFCAAARLHHRRRLLMAPDVACEGVDSLMRLFWRSRRTSGDVAGRIADNVTLASANFKCVGGCRADALVAAVVDTTRSTSSYKPRAFKHTMAYVEATSEVSGTGSSGDFALDNDSDKNIPHKRRIHAILLHVMCTWILRTASEPLRKSFATVLPCTAFRRRIL
jgi:hypothetical protein